jgi:ParB-like chromosome segregation protein Spo0J
MPKFKAAELVWDSSIYPRQDINEMHVNDLAASLRLGNQLPPVTIEGAGKRIVDGLHRWRAQRKVNGNDCEIECVVKSYANDGEMFLDAIALNAAHGLRLTKFEQTRCLVLAEAKNINPELVCKAMRIEFDKGERVMRSSTGFRRLGDGNRERIPLKGSLSALRGKTLTREQEATNEYAGGMKPLYYINHVIGLVRSRVIDWGGENVVAGLRELHGLLAEGLPKRTKA